MHGAGTTLIYQMHDQYSHHVPSGTESPFHVIDYPYKRPYMLNQPLKFPQVQTTGTWYGASRTATPKDLYCSLLSEDSGRSGGSESQSEDALSVKGMLCRISLQHL
jgi:hypothetical protein